MGLSAGTRLGPYEILSLLGAGGMGEVYRARDTRLARDVAIKVLPDEVATDPRALARFEHEAKAVAALSHPNILALYDVGESGGIHYAVTELLQGQNLRLTLADGPLPVRRALDIAVQIAEALAAAHDNGIVHRDLKPENVFLGPDGRVKLLDFGLARHDASHRDPNDTRSPTVTDVSRPGSVTGTVAYMSPEQAKGGPVDFRSDQFSLGIVLYEMLAGARPFVRPSAAETLTAIIREEPEPVEKTAPATPAPVRFLVERLLTKEPDGRYDSTRDLARELTTWKLHPSGATGDLVTPPPRGVSRRHRQAIAMFGFALLAAAGTGLLIGGQKAGRAPLPTYKQITLRRGTVTSARFTPDLQSVVYSASWEGKPAELFVQRLASADARSLGLAGARVIGTAGGDVAILRGDTLARLPLEGGTPRDLLKDVIDAAWDRSGDQLAIVRLVKGRQRLEYPIGKVLLETTGIEAVGQIRFSPDASRIAFVSGPPTDESGDVCVIDTSGKRQTLSKGWPVIDRLIWSPDGNEIWFSATRAGIKKELHSVSLSGKERLVARPPGDANLQDISPDGRVLITFGQSRRFEVRGRVAGDVAERDLSWLDGTILPMLSPDGSQTVFQEWGEGGGQGSTYHWRVGSSSATRLCDGAPLFVSPDWTTVLVGFSENGELKLVPIGAGETRTLPRGPVRSIVWGRILPDGKRIVIQGTDADGNLQLFVQDVADGPPRPFAPGNYWGPHTPDGRFITVRPKPDGPLALRAIDGAETRPLPFLDADVDVPLIFAEDGNSLFVADSCCGRKFPVHVVRLDLKTGKREPWLALSPPDLTGVPGNFSVYVTPNGRYYAYGYRRTLSDLYQVEGLK